ncbi:carboxyl transferase [Falcatimonas sp. MSJ-15]|uniref:acyl-CoA carboxylase subunit beta n=1 Tax=Falcatimonas sp. MSJ-15 TaxID=2841515 RepID=UPI001C11FFEF|nr:carboxyl transferase domain-containing protein [Falcatimonas sp. MSJ-15]MBU5469467.1 carboxyl transferase [Falcatimonas sp. MSJ-15]
MSNTAQVSASKRINALLDDNSFVEIGGYVTARNTDFNLQHKETPADGVITGYGVIDGNLVYVYSQDATVLNGALGEMHAKKIAKVYDLAMKMGAPVIGLIDCAGLRLQEATDALNGFGELYLKQTMASGVIPQITAIFGNCGGGLAIIPTLTDFTFMEEKNAKLFVNSPNALSENKSQDTAGADFQSKETGIVDFTGDEDAVIEQIRTLVNILPANNEDDNSYDECTDDLNRVCSDLANAKGDTSIALSNISDDNFFYEVKKSYAKDMVTGFIRLNGMTVGAVANRTEVYDDEMNLTDSYKPELTTNGCEKAAEFINFCDAFNIPVLTLTNVNGYKATVDEEKTIAKAVAKLTYAFANATIPKVNVVIGEAFGSAYLAMNSKSIGADIVYAWPDAKIGMMQAQSAVKIMYADEINNADDATKLISEKSAEYEKLQSSALAAAKRGYVDDIIEACDTRKRIIAAFEMLYTKREDRPAKKHGTI